MTDILKRIWMNLFGTTEFLGLNIGFWVSVAVVVLLVVLMNVVFWSFHPQKKKPEKQEIIQMIHEINEKD